jgi:hypothetical protein
MSRRAWLVLVIGLLLAAGAVLLVGGSPPHRGPGSGRPPALAPLAPPRMTQLRAPARSGQTRIVAAVGPHYSDPERVARTFLLGWLACTYHQRACTSIPGTLDAYREALGRQHARSLPTPAERLVHPSVLLVQTVRACQGSTTATATYKDGEGGRFQLHLSLVDQRSGWKVFDVAEAAPHIPLPAELNHGPGRC